MVTLKVKKRPKINKQQFPIAQLSITALKMMEKKTFN